VKKTKALTQRSLRKNAKGSLWLVVAALLLPLNIGARAAAPEVKKKVIYDQDFNGIIGGDADPLVMLLQAPNVQVLGVTVITGDGWLKQETADALKLLEDLHRTDVPVYMGAEFPLVQSPKNLVRLTHMYGGSRTDPFLGAYGEYSEPPDTLVAPFGGFAKTKAAPGSAAEFIIEQVHKYPHEVTLYCGGPLTNVALAIKLDPEVVGLTKEIVFMGTSPEMQPKTVNVMYDPESAQIVLHAAWPKLTLITVDVAEKLHRTPEMAEAIAKGNNTAEAKLYEELVMKPYREHKPLQWFRMPDELTAAYIIDPTIVTEMRRYYVDVDTMQGMSYGSSIYWDEVPKGYGGIPWPDKPEPKRQKPIPPVDARVADVVWNFDTAKLQAMFLKAMTEPMQGTANR
jgi:purine nucleosidase